MKILISITYYYPNISGLTNYAQLLAEELVKRGHEVTVLTSWHNKNLPKEEMLHGVKVVRVPVTFSLGKGVMMMGLPVEAVKLIPRVDIVNCHLPQFESSLICLLAKLLGKKVILTHHTDLSGWSGLFNQLAESSVYLSQLVAAGLADSIVTYTKDYADHSTFLQKFKPKLKYIYPPLKSYPVDKDFQKNLRQKIGRAQYLIGFAGRIARQKGLPHLLESISYLKESLDSFKVVLAGPYQEVIGEKTYESLAPLIEKYKKYLVFLGAVPAEKMASFYNLLDVLVLPSDDRLESFGLVQVEAMFQGCPVVATNLPGMRIPVQKSGMGEIVPPQDDKKLAEAIVRVVKDKPKLTTKKTAALREFSFSKTIDFYEKEVFKI